jgi:hypothetical protein
MENMKSTAIYPNRIEDKEKLERECHLPEFPKAPGFDVFPTFESEGQLIAKGYERIVYGDHGPYIEFTKEQIVAPLASKFGNKIDFDNLPENPRFYYYWLYPEGNPDIKIYLQLKTVVDKPNAPKRQDGKRSTYNRPEGYADYRVGYYYIDPYQLDIVL